VKNSLHRIGVGIDDDTESILGGAFLFGECASYADEMSHQLFIRFLEHVNRVDVTVGHNEYMGGCGRLNIAKGGHLLVAIHNRAGDFPCENFAKDT
jgi:hypothetical protein